MNTYQCRLCSSWLSNPKINLGRTPLANDFLENRRDQSIYPLEICVCLSCSHYQLNETIPPEQLFSHYSYVSGTSSINIDHFKKYALEMIKLFGLTNESKVLDIGSNDGTLLSIFQEQGVNILGIDPAQNIAEIANKNGIETLANFFTKDYADIILEKYGQFDLITANNVFAHVPNLLDFAKGIQKLLSKKGVFSFEVSYFVDVCQKGLADTIYHEHSSYHTITPLISFFDNLGMELFDVKEIENHGGSIRVFVSHKNEFKVSSIISDFIKKEKNMEEMINQFNIKIKELKLSLNAKLSNIKKSGQSIAIYGVPAKATTLLYALDIDPQMIDFAVDDATLKQGKFTPGFHIPIFHPDTIYKRSPDYLLVLAWNFAKSIIENHKTYKGSWIIPLPILKVI